MSDTSSLRLKVIKIWAYTVPPDREKNWGYLNVSFEATTIWTLSDCSFSLLYRMKVDQFIVPYWVTLILYCVCFRVTHSIVLPFERFRASPRDPNQVSYSDQPSFYSLELAETKNAIIITQSSRRLWCRWLSFSIGEPMKPKRNCRFDAFIRVIDWSASSRLSTPPSPPLVLLLTAFYSSEQNSPSCCFHAFCCCLEKGGRV